MSRLPRHAPESSARRLSRLERWLAIALALVWLGGGIAALVLAVAESRWSLGACALLALPYGAAWLRIAARARLLTWAELVAPWRSIGRRQKTS
jgi:hypothetical protein